VRREDYFREAIRNEYSTVNVADLHRRAKVKGQEETNKRGSQGPACTGVFFLKELGKRVERDTLLKAAKRGWKSGWVLVPKRRESSS